MQISGLKWKKKTHLTSNLHQLHVLLTKQRERVKCFSLSALLTSQRARLDVWFWFRWHSVKRQESKVLQVVGTPPQEASGPTQSFEMDTGVIDQGLWVARDFFPRPNGPQFLCNNNWVHQENGHLVSPIISIAQRKRAVERREAKRKK